LHRRPRVKTSAIATMIAVAAVTAVETATALVIAVIAVIANRAAAVTAAAVVNEVANAAAIGTARATRSAKRRAKRPRTAPRQTLPPARNATLRAMLRAAIVTASGAGVEAGVGGAARIAHPKAPPCPPARRRLRSLRRRRQGPMMQRSQHRCRTCLRHPPKRCSCRHRPRVPSPRVKPSPTRRALRRVTRERVVVVADAAAAGAVEAVRTATMPPTTRVRQARIPATPAPMTRVVTRHRTPHRRPRSSLCRPCLANSRRSVGPASQPPSRHRR
jgi:hypothetical protein